MENNGELTAHITTGAAIVYFIQYIKASNCCRWLTADTKTLNRVVSAVLAGVAAVGINWTYNPTLDGGTLIITGVSLQAVLVALWEWCKQFAMQQLIFDGIVDSSTRLKE